MITETEQPLAPPREYESEELQNARKLDRLGRTIEVLITVKTSPQPSTKYGDTVCVAGLALDPLRWVRLYPIRFRHLEQSNQFTKYEIVKVPVSNSAEDNRIESLKVEADKIERVRALPTRNGWIERAQIIEHIGLTTLCELQREVRNNIDAPSLGMIEPILETFRVIVKPGKGWTPRQKEKLEKEWNQETLDLGLPQVKNPPILESRPVDVWLSFKCCADCKYGHTIGFLDWEATGLMRREQANGFEAMERIIKERFEANPSKPGKNLRIFVGNQSDPTKRGSFEALGLYYPDKSAVVEAARPKLF